MRSLGWPPEGVESKPPAEGAAAVPVTPFELAPDPGGSGALVAVEVEQPPRLVEVLPEPAAPPAAVAEGDGAQILKELRSLRQAVDALTVAVRSLGDSGAARATGAVAARHLSDQQARQEIQEYFLRHQNQTLFPAQIADALGLPLLKVAELCEAMATRGQISRDAGP